MNCFPCFQSQKSKKGTRNGERSLPAINADEPKAPETKKQKPEEITSQQQIRTQTQTPAPTQTQTPTQTQEDQNKNINAQTFTFRELASATKNFRHECLLGEGGFGRVYRGTLQSTGQVVAVKQLDRNGLQGNKEFLVEVLTLSLLHHPNLVNLVGYCADGDQRLLVYEYMPGGSVEDHLLDIKEEQKPLDWITRMKIAYGAAQGLEYLHDRANPPVIYRDLKSSNILLDENFEPKLSDFGLAKLGPLGDKMNVSSRVMGTYGYCAPEYNRSGNLTMKSDVYSFGVVLLELITGRRVIDTTRPVDEQNLIAWAQPIFRDPKRYPDMADPFLRKRVPERGLNQAVAIAAMCLQEEAGARPLMSDVVTALSFLSKPTEDIPDPMPNDEQSAIEQDGDGDEDEDEDASDYDENDSATYSEEDSSKNHVDDQERQSHQDNNINEASVESNTGGLKSSSRRKSTDKNVSSRSQRPKSDSLQDENLTDRSTSSRGLNSKSSKEKSQKNKRSKSTASMNKKSSRKSKKGSSVSSSSSSSSSSRMGMKKSEGLDTESAFPTEKSSRSESPKEITATSRVAVEANA